LVIGGAGLLLIAGMTAALISPTVLVKATSACFVAVYVATTCAAVRILRGGARVAAMVSAVFVITIAGFSGSYLAVPAASAVCFIALRPGSGRRRAGRAPRRSRGGLR
jgi:amino acid efflux transporter